MAENPPLPLPEFEEKNRRVQLGDAVPDLDLDAWRLGRDWLAARSMRKAPGLKRKTPRVNLAAPAHLAGVGPAVTENLGFRGIALRAGRRGGLVPGEEASVRLQLGGRSIYALGKVVWAGDGRIGIAIESIHPEDERALQAAVCGRLLEHWDR